MRITIGGWAAILFVVLFAVLAVAIAVFWRITGFPTKAQINKVREWLLYAVTMAEKDLGGGTGKLKLRQVYDLFVQRFPWVAKVITFEYFSSLVDEALEQMHAMLDTNTAVAALVQGETTTAKTETEESAS